jgi:mercuric ion binding protein
MPASTTSQLRSLMISVGASVLLSGIPLAAIAAPKTVTLSIPGMDCPVCPITVKKALSQVSGVSQTTVNFERRQAVVTFDDSKTNVGALTESTKNAGYPSTLAGAGN